MDSYLDLNPKPFVEGFNPTQHQREIYYFYDKKYSDKAEDIYSLEWFKRTQAYEQQSNKHATTLHSWADIEAMEFSTFFLAHPIAAFALWQFLEASYALDEIICPGIPNQTIEWRTWPPFEYLSSSEVVKGWQKCLEDFQHEDDRGLLKKTTLVSKVCSIEWAMRNLEHAFDDLIANFEESLKGMRFTESMVDVARKLLRSRRKLVKILY